jgi:hypothetical protein
MRKMMSDEWSKLAVPTLDILEEVLAELNNEKKILLAPSNSNLHEREHCPLNEELPNQVLL